MGIDVVPEFVEHAHSVSGQDDWRFEVTDGTSIPEKDDCADFVTFFSVFTHVCHEQTYQYLVEAARVLKPGGKIVFSFIEFKIPDHWTHFANSLHSYATENKPIDIFLSRDAIECFALHVDLQIDCIIDGDKPHIKIEQPIEFSNGMKASVMAKLGPIGQSVCILTKKSE